MTIDQVEEVNDDLGEQLENVETISEALLGNGKSDYDDFNEDNLLHELEALTLNTSEGDDKIENQEIPVVLPELPTLPPPLPLPPMTRQSEQPPTVTSTSTKSRVNQQEEPRSL